jgi:hypothetical protein
MEKLLNYIEAESRLNMAFHMANGEALCKESNTFLQFLLAAGGALLAFLVSLSSKSPIEAWQFAGVTSAAVYFFALAALLVWKCLWVQDIWPPANEPGSFPLDPQYDFDTIREIELTNRQKCIDGNRNRNAQVGKWLSRCRGLAAAMPVVATIGAWALRAA